jgi:uncharacterized membrane protein YebE (DUF533 family)
MKISDLLGTVMQSGMAPSSTDRVKNSLGGGGALEGLAGLFGGASGGASRSPLANILGEVSQAVGGQQNLALGGLGALAGSLLGGGRKSMGGAVGGGAMALLGVIAYQALKAHSGKKAPVPLGLREPKTPAEKRQLEKNSELILKAMINAAKADGQIDEKESRKIIGKIKKSGADDEGLQFIMMEMQKPMETGKLMAAAKGKPELAAEMYTASLLAVEVDTPEERHYLQDLASGMGIDPRVARSIEQAVGVKI